MPVKLEYKLKKGDESKYKTDVITSREIVDGEEVEKGTTHLIIVTTQKVEDLDANGNMKLKVTVDSADLEKGGMKVPTGAAEGVINMTMASNGQIVDMGGVPSQMGSQQATFPKDPVDVGSTWSSETKFNLPEGQAVNLKTIYTYDKNERIEGYDCAKIVIDTPNQEIPLEEDAVQNLKISGLMYFAPKEGRLIRSESTIDTSVVLAEDQKVATTTTMIISLQPALASRPEEDFLIAK